jgi:hypothetical protein
MHDFSAYILATTVPKTMKAMTATTMMMMMMMMLSMMLSMMVTMIARAEVNTTMMTILTFSMEAAKLW